MQVAFEAWWGGLMGYGDSRDEVFLYVCLGHGNGLLGATVLGKPFQRHDFLNEIQKLGRVNLLPRCACCMKNAIFHTPTGRPPLNGTTTAVKWYMDNAPVLDPEPLLLVMFFSVCINPLLGSLVFPVPKKQIRLHLLT